MPHPLHGDPEEDSDGCCDAHGELDNPPQFMHLREKVSGYAHDVFRNSDLPAPALSLPSV